MSRSLSRRAVRCGLVAAAWLGPALSGLASATPAATLVPRQNPQADALPEVAKDLDVAKVQAQLDAARAIEPVEGDTTRDERIQRYEAAVAALESRDRWNAARARFESREASAAARIEQAEAALAGELPPHPPLAGKDLAALESILATAQLDAETARAKLQALDEEVRRAPERRLALPDEIARADQRLTELVEAETAAIAAGESATLPAITTLRSAQIEETRAKAAALRAEEQSFETRLAANEAELREARRFANHAAGWVTKAEEAVSAARKAKAEEERVAAQRSRRDALMQGEAFRATADDALQLREETLALAKAFDVDKSQLDRVQRNVESLTERFEDTKARTAITALTAEVGLRLRQDRSRLVEVRESTAEVAGISERLTRTQAELFDLDVVRESLLDEDRWIESLVNTAMEEGRLEEDVRPVARKLLTDYQDAITAKIKALNDQFALLSSLKAQSEALDAKVQEYEEFVAERILWVRSSEPIWKVSSRSVKLECQCAVEPSRWSSALRALGRDLLARPLETIGILASLFALLALRLRLRRALSVEADLARQRSQVSIKPSLRALLLTIMLAAPYAAALFAISWLIRSGDARDAFVDALGAACEHAGYAVFVIEALRALCMRDGLGEAHFEWAEESVRRVRRQSAWLLTVLPAATFLTEFLVEIESAALATSTTDELLPRIGAVASGAVLSRIAFVVSVSSAFVFLLRVLHPSRGVLAINARAALPDDWLTRLRRAWFLLAVTAFGALLLVTLLGYDFTARSLFSRFGFTLGFLLVLLVLRSLALRWVRLERRSEALGKLRKKREELRAKRLQEIERRRNAGEDVGELESEGLEVLQDEVDFAALSSDVRDLVRMFTGLAAVVGVVVIWASVLPALGFLETYWVWQHQVSGTDVQVDPSGVERVVQSIDIVKITLANVLTAIIASLLTWRAVRDLPSLLEIVLLRRIKLGSGERYAITTLLRYVLTIIGMVVVFNELGLSWNKLQWLVAGVSVGLGFGLQEIFANFVSGITLLFERPIRVGDWVTLGEIEGVVSKIRIRATTIRDRDLKELIVPNREFITGRFINWTLSDPVSRVLVTVGIAYGSDTEKAIQLLLEAGRESAYSVAEPAPNVVFRRFGESSLDFEVRIFVHGREIFPRVVHDLHMRIDSAFRRAGIEISFPQRDLHVRSAPMFEKSAPAEGRDVSSGA